MFDSINIENGLYTLDQEITEVRVYGPTRALLFDNGSEFSSRWKQKKEESKDKFHKQMETYGKGLLPPGFEPGSPARKAGMIDRTTPRERFVSFYLQLMLLSWLIFRIC